MVFEDPVSGYEAMWSHIGDVARGEASPLIPLETLLDDLGFAMDVVDSCDKRDSSPPRPGSWDRRHSIRRPDAPSGVFPDSEVNFPAAGDAALGRSDCQWEDILSRAARAAARRLWSTGVKP
jgi:hypothetical protein